MSSDKHYFSGLLRKNIWIYFFSFIIAPLGYITKILMTRTVSVEDYGVFTAVMGFVMILGAYNDFGMTDSLNYFLPAHIHDKNSKKITQTFSIAFTTQLVSTLLLACVLYFGSSFLAVQYFKNPLSATLLHIFIPYFFIDNFFRLLNTFFLAVQDTKIQK
jgi:O-antigen/teichoic acid export membrane protein